MRKLRITIENKSYEVTVEDLTEEPSFAPPAQPTADAQRGPSMAPVARPESAKATASAAPAGAVTCPMAGVIGSVLVKDGDQVEQGQDLLVLEAMKMENHISAPSAGVVQQLNVKPGDNVREGQTLLVLE